MFQGRGGPIDDILGQTAELTTTLAQRDQAIGEVITNLNAVPTTVANSTRRHFETIQQPLSNQRDCIDDLLTKLPTRFRSSCTYTPATTPVADVYAPAEGLAIASDGTAFTVQNVVPKADAWKQMLAPVAG